MLCSQFFQNEAKARAGALLDHVQYGGAVRTEWGAGEFNAREGDG